MGTRIVFFVLFLLSSNVWAADVNCRFNDCFRGGWVANSAQGANSVVCVRGDCLYTGFTNTDSFGRVVLGTCLAGGCYVNGWVEHQQYPPYQGFETYCKPGGCMYGGWTTYANDQAVLDVSCTNLSCARFGWTSVQGGAYSQAQCKFGDCFRYGWTTYP